MGLNANNNNNNTVRPEVSKGPRESAQGFDKLSPNGNFFGAGPSIPQDERVGLNANNNDNTVRPEQGTEPVEGPR